MERDEALAAAQKSSEVAAAAYASFEPATVKAAKVQAASAAALESLSLFDWETDGTAPERGMANLIRGRLLDLRPDHCPEAEALLTKAVKLLPGHPETWNALGHAFWKNSDLVGARNCFGNSLENCRSKQTLQALSMLLRFMARASNSSNSAASSPTEHPFELAKQSLAAATEAVTADVSDDASWYALGMAHLALFFARKTGGSDATGGASGAQGLRQALKAFANAERCGAGAQNPDLHFNRAMVLKFLEEYQSAAEGFARAGELDPALPWQLEIFSIGRTLQRVAELTAAKGRLKPKLLQQISSSIASAPPPPSPWRRAAGGVAALASGPNPGLALQCRLLVSAAPSGGGGGGAGAPLYFVMVDECGAAFALSVIGLVEGAIRGNAVVTLLAPTLRNVPFQWPPPPSAAAATAAPAAAAAGAGADKDASSEGAGDRSDGQAAEGSGEELKGDAAGADSVPLKGMVIGPLDLLLIRVDGGGSMLVGGLPVAASAAEPPRAVISNIA